LEILEMIHPDVQLGLKNVLQLLFLSPSLSARKCLNYYSLKQFIILCSLPISKIPAYCNIAPGSNKNINSNACTNCMTSMICMTCIDSVTDVNFKMFLICKIQNIVKLEPKFSLCQLIKTFLIFSKDVY
jgi:hypothetical protein